MRIEETNLADTVEDIFISEYGIFYFFDGYIISELNEDIVYTWEAAQEAIEAAYRHYGDDPSVCYITNRVNNYSVKPADWIKFFTTKNELNGYAIVSYNEASWTNILIEKLFLRTKVERFDDLYEAIHWAKQINNTISKKSKIA